MAKATPKQPNTIVLDNHEVTTRAKGKSLRSGKLLPDILQNLGSVADPLPEDENIFDNISVSDSEEDDGFNHWTSNEGRCVLIVNPKPNFDICICMYISILTMCIVQ